MGSADAEALARQVRERLEEGDLDPDDLRRLLARRERNVTTLVVAAGMALAFAGIVLLYAVNFTDMPRVARLLTPYVFPATLFATSAPLLRPGRARWLGEVAAAAGYAGLIGAVAASMSAVHTHVDATVAVLSAAFAVAIAIVLWRVPRAPVSSWLALGVAAGASVVATAVTQGIDDEAMRWVLLPLGLVAWGLGLLALRQKGPARAVGAGTSLGTLALVTAAMMGASLVEARHLTAWHALLTLVVIVAILTSAFLSLPELAFAGALSGLLWLAMAIPLVADQPAWAIAVIALGAVIAGGTVLVSRHRRRRTTLHS